MQLRRQRPNHGIHSLRRHFQDDKGIGRCHQQTAQQRRPAAEFVRFLNLDLVVLVLEKHHTLFHEQYAYEKLHSPKDDGPQLCKKSVPAHRRRFLPHKARNGHRPEEHS